MKPSEAGAPTLECGRLRVQLSPSIDGPISAFEWIGEGYAKAILRKCHTPLEKLLDACSFPLVPYVNRIRGLPGLFALAVKNLRGRAG
jgi:hypothetical protein